MLSCIMHDCTKEAATDRLQHTDAIYRNSIGQYMQYTAAHATYYLLPTQAC